MPENKPGLERNDERQIVSGIIRVARTGCRWCEYPSQTSALTFGVPQILTRAVAEAG